VCDHANEVCPYLPGHAIRIHHNFPDPAKAIGTVEAIEKSFRSTRDEIKNWCLDFAKERLDSR
ncbi:MAG TPA: arsenate reductase ArsC, partial [Bacteroidia bacterium]|nr:arsenate reductase ArsC [Bacteroidia bacterium]